MTKPEFRANGTRRAVVVPLSDVALTCHLAPQFRQLAEANEGDLVSPTGNLLDTASHFFLNHFYTHYLFLLIFHWRQNAPPLRDRL